MAPEVLTGKAYDEKADLWSVGIMLYQMVCGRVPFPAATPAELKRRVLKGVYRFPEDVDVSPICLDMIQKLIVLDPTKRISFKDFLNHHFSVSDEEIYKMQYNEAMRAHKELKKPFIKETRLGTSYFSEYSGNSVKNLLDNKTLISLMSKAEKPKINSLLNTPKASLVNTPKCSLENSLEE
jgi:serine/threonine protein kinase